MLSEIVLYEKDPFHVKKPECPARKSGAPLKGGDEWIRGLFLWKQPRAGARGSLLQAG
jgi:hypothetical protein